MNNSKLKNSICKISRFFSGKALTAVALSAMLCPMLFSCSDDDKGAPFPPQMLADLMTVEDISQSGLTLICQRTQKSEPITFTAPGVKVDTSLHKGYRVVVDYVTENPDINASGNIKIYGLGRAFGSGLYKFPKDGLPETQEVSVYTMYLTGNYLNTRFNADIVKSIKYLAMFVDTLSLATDTPKLYMRFLIPEPERGEVPTSKIVYGSWDISSLYKYGDYKSLEVNVDNARGADVFTINLKD